MWFSDLKWIISLVTIVGLSLTLSLATLFALSAREPVVEGISLTYAVMLSGEKGIDNPEDVEKLKQEMIIKGETSFQPLPGIEVSISRDEIENLSPREARLALMRKFAIPIYDGGAEGVAALTTDPELKAKIFESRKTLDLLSHKTHDRVRQWLFFSILLVSILALAAIFFSYRWGRLATPGWILVVASLPGTLFWWSLTRSVPKMADGAAAVTNTQDLARFVAGQILPAPAQNLFLLHRELLFIGLALIVVAMLGGLIFRRQHGKETPKTIKDEPAARP